MKAKALVFLVLLSSVVVGLEAEAREPFLICAQRALVNVGVAVADTLPVTAAVIDTVIGEGDRWDHSSGFENSIELLGGGVTFFAEISFWAFLFSQGASPDPSFIPELIFASPVPYRSTQTTWRRFKRSCI